MNNRSVISVDSAVYTYISFGAAAIVSNVIILTVLLCDMQLLKKSGFLVGLAIADVIDGSGLLSNGAVRLVRTLNGTSSLLVHPLYCMTIVVTPLLLLGNQISGAMFLLIGVERLLAVGCYQWYYANWSNRLSWKLTLIVYVFGFLSISVAFFLAFIKNSNERILIFCSLQLVVGDPYTYYNYIFSTVGGIIAISSTVLGLVIFTNRKKHMFHGSDVSMNMKTHVKHQWSISKVLLCLSIIDFSFVVVPNLLFISTTKPIIRGWALQLICLRSVFNILIYLLINSEFRTSVFRMLHIKIQNMSVHPVVFENA